jgi:hypothetical protein
MASTITAGNATNGLALSCDNTGILELKTGTGAGTTAMTINASQVTSFAGATTSFSGNVGIGTSSPGTRLQLGNNSNASELARFANTLANFDVGVTAGGCQLYTANSQPIVFSNNAAERIRIDTSGNVLVTSAAGLGYGTGAGGTVTQATNKATAVTLNRPTGRITTSNAALAANTTVSFLLNNSLIASDDVLVLDFDVGSLASNYQIWSGGGAASRVICIRNITGSSLSDALFIRFAIIKGSTT